MVGDTVLDWGAVKGKRVLTNEREIKPLCAFSVFVSRSTANTSFPRSTTCTHSFKSTVVVREVPIPESGNGTDTG